MLNFNKTEGFSFNEDISSMSVSAKNLSHSGNQLTIKTDLTSNGHFDNIKILENFSFDLPSHLLRDTRKFI